MSAQGSGNCQILSPAQGLNFVQGGNAGHIVKTLIDTQLSCSVSDVKTISYQQLSDKPEYHIIKARIDEDIKNNRDNLKILIFPAKSSGYHDASIKDREIFFINDGKNTYMTNESLASRELRSAYLHIKGERDEPNAQIAGDDFVIAGHADDTVVFKIPWKQEWGENGLPASNDVNGFNQLYEKINQQQNQTANISNQMTQTNKNVNSAELQQQKKPPINANNTTTPAVKKINIIVKYNGTHVMPGFDPNTPISELIMQIRKKFKNENVEVIYLDEYRNQKKLDANDDRPLSSVFNRNPVELTVSANRSDIQTLQNQNNNQPSQNILGTSYNNMQKVGNNIIQESYHVPTAQQNNTINLTCVNQSVLRNQKIVLENIEIPKNATVCNLKEQILATTNNETKALFESHKVQTDHFVVCKVDQNGKPAGILDDNATISTAFSGDTKYVIVPKEICCGINVNGQERDFNYPVIVKNSSDKYEFNKESLKNAINKQLGNENKTIVSTDVTWDNQNGLEVIIDLDSGGFVPFGPINITTKDITPRPVLVKRPVPRLVTMRPPVVPQVVPVPVPVKTVVGQPPKFVPQPVTVAPINNNPFGDRTTGYIPGLRIFQRRPAQVPPRPLFVPPPKFVPRPAPRPVQTFRPPTVVPVPRLMTVPPRPLVVPPVVPVPQSGDGRPEPDTYYVLQGYTKNMNTQVTNWSPQPTQRIPMDYQTYINQNIHGAQPFRPSWRPQYQYCDELGMIFESDSPIYKDVNNNLVTLGNARYRTP